jgi:hypothetical protein
VIIDPYAINMLSMSIEAVSTPFVCWTSTVSGCARRDGVHFWALVDFVRLPVASIDLHLQLPLLARMPWDTDERNVLNSMEQSWRNVSISTCSC